MEVQKKDSILVQFWYNLFQLAGPQRVATMFLLVLIVFIASLIFSYLSPSAGEAWVYNMTLFAGILNACFLGVVSLMVLSVGINLTTLIIGAGIKQAREMNAPTANEYIKELPMNTDLIIAEQPGEPDFSARVKRELDTVGSDKFVAVIRFRHPEILFIMNGKEDTKGRGQIVDGYNANAITENFDDYEAFVTDAYLHLSVFFADHRKKTGNASVRESYLGVGARLACFAFLILAPFALFSQSKTERVQAGVPQIAGQVVAKGVGVQYQFASGEITRTADGTSTVAQMVAQNRPGADKDNMGELKSVVIGTTVFEAKKNEQPKPLFVNASPQTVAMQMPDSTKVVAGIEEIKASLPFYKTKLWGIVKPIIGFVYWMLLFLGVVLLSVIAFFNLVSRSAAENGNLSPSVQRMQVEFASYAWYCAMALAGTVFILFSLTVFFLEWHPLLSAALIWIGMLVAKFIVNRLTPNGQYQKQVTTTRTVSNGPGLPRG